MQTLLRSSLVLFIAVAQGHAVNILNESQSAESVGIVFDVWHHTWYGDDPDFLSFPKARTTANAFSNVTERMVSDLSFAYPWWNGLDNHFTVNCFNLDVEGRAGTAWAHKVDLDAPFLMRINEIEIRALCLHEVFHQMQRQYIRGDFLGFAIYLQLGSFGTESTATFAQDIVFSDLDTQSGQFQDQALRLVWCDPGTRLPDREYDGALFWTYATEQLGTETNEPTRGIDFFYEVFEEIRVLSASTSYNSLFNAFRNVLDQKGTDLRQLYSRFGLCNGIHHLAVSASVEKRLGGSKSVRYADNVGDEFEFPENTFVTTLPFLSTGFVNPLGTQYHLLELPAVPPGSYKLVGAKVESLLPADVYMAAINGLDAVVDVERSQGTEMTRTYLLGGANSSVKRVLIVSSSATERRTLSQVRIVEGDPQSPTILSPSDRHPVFMSRDKSWGMLPIRVRIDGPSELKPMGAYPRAIAGLRAHHFDLEVGENTETARTAMYLGGDYYLASQIFTSSYTNGIYDLKVSYLNESNLFDIANQSVIISTQQVNHAIVLDRSFSMINPSSSLKFNAMKEAASFYAQSTWPEDGLIVVAFEGNGAECDEDATVVYSDPGTRLNNDAAEAAINALTLGSLTSIGDGLWTALDELDAMRGTGPTQEQITLLTDGVENEARFWAQTSACDSGVIHRLTNTSVVVHGIALGRDADAGLVQGIARQSGGAYSYIDVPPVPSARSSVGASAAPSANNSLQIDLHRAYLESREEVDGLARFFTEYGQASSGTTQNVQFPLVDPLVTNGLFLVAWNNTNVAPALILSDPGGTTITPVEAVIATGRTFAVYRLNDSVTAGTFDLSITPQRDIGWMATFSGHSIDPLEFVFRFGQIGTGGGTGVPEDTTRERLEEGVPVQMLASVLTTNGPLTNVTIRIEITLPDGTTHCGPALMADDASQGDQSDNDGIYGLHFTQTRQASTTGVDKENNPAAPDGTNGSYQIYAAATGVDEQGNPFSREFHGSFHVYQRIEQRDSDLDTIPDTWEIHHGTDPQNPLDAQEDPDLDNLLTVAEYQASTHPFNADTDGGGEADGSEVSFGRCPFDPDDDILPPLYDLAVVRDTGCIDPLSILKPNSVTLRWSMMPEYHTMSVFRSSNPTNGFFLLTNIVHTALGDNLFCDQGLPPGTNVYYRLQPISSVGAYGPVSLTLDGVAWSDPIPPSGTASILPPATKSDRLFARVHLRATTNVTTYVINSLPLDGTEPFIPFTPTATNGAWEVIDWVLLEPPLNDPGRSTIFAQFITAEGRRSRVVSSSILVDFFGDHDLDSDQNMFDLDDDDDTLSDADEINLYYTDPFSADTDSDGLGDADELSVSFTSPLNADTDGDGLSDFEETIVHGTLPAVRDTDGDGLSDGYEVANGLDPNVDDGAALLDPDGDGVSTIDECRTGTDPLDGSSVFRAAIEIPDPVTTRISFPAAPPHSYRLRETDALQNETWDSRGVFPAIDTTQLSIDVPRGTNETRNNYHVEFLEHPFAP